MVDLELKRQLDSAGLSRLESVPHVAQELPAGVRMLDLWRNSGHGAVLFWVAEKLDLWGFGDAVRHLVMCECVGGRWRCCGGGGHGTLTAAEYLAEMGVGLHRVGGSSGGPVRLTLALASPEVSSIELRSDDDVSSRSPGVDGFCLLGITHSDPITYARPLAADGRPLGHERLLL